MKLVFFYILISYLQLKNVADCHGRLMDPPSRNAMWRFGFPNPVNYNDNELYCGGYGVQHLQNNGQCGVCGDNWSNSKPRAHEALGTYANGVIGKTYAPGQIIELAADLTANHKGYFMAKLCVNDNFTYTISQQCLNEQILPLAGSGARLYKIPDDSPKAGTFRWKVQLPSRLTCMQCVLQWTYFTGNTWGVCSDGEYGLGCGPQETFINCADVAIMSNAAFSPTLDNSLQSIHENGIAPWTELVEGDEEASAVTKTVFKETCVPRNPFDNDTTAAEVCIQCLSSPENCDWQRCQCIDECEAVGEFSLKKDADIFCHQRCLRYPSQCPSDKCHCH